MRVDSISMPEDWNVARQQPARPVGWQRAGFFQLLLRRLIQKPKYKEPQDRGTDWISFAPDLVIGLVIEALFDVVYNVFICI